MFPGFFLAHIYSQRSARISAFSSSLEPFLSLALRMFSIKNIALVLSTVAAVQAVSLPSYEEALDHAARGLVPREFAEALNPAVEKRAATFMCHAACGLAIYGAWECGPEAGPFDEECLCAADSAFSTQIEECLDCGWCLYMSYFGNLAGPLDACGLPIVPTGTDCAETASTLTPTLGPFTDYTPTHPNNVPTPTEEPTSEEPTSEEPTSEEPTSEEPTEEPTSEEPTSEEPTSEEPTEEPTSEEPTSEEPTEEPTIAPTGEPTEEPTEEPTSEEPTSEEPTSEEPTSEEPTEEPTIAPTGEPTEEPTVAPTGVPTSAPPSEYYGNTTTVLSTIAATSIIEYTTCITDVNGHTTTVTVPCHGKCTASPTVHPTDLTKTYTASKAVVSGKTVTVTVECETSTTKPHVPGTTSTKPHVPGTTSTKPHVPGTTTHVPGTTTHVPGTTTHTPVTTPIVTVSSSIASHSTISIQTHSGAANKLSVAGAALVGYAGLMLL